MNFHSNLTHDKLQFSVSQISLLSYLLAPERLLRLLASPSIRSKLDTQTHCSKQTSQGCLYATWRSRFKSKANSKQSGIPFISGLWVWHTLWTWKVHRTLKHVNVDLLLRSVSNWTGSPPKVMKKFVYWHRSMWVNECYGRSCTVYCQNDRNPSDVSVIVKKKKVNHGKYRLNTTPVTAMLCTWCEERGVFVCGYCSYWLKTRHDLSLDKLLLSHRRFLYDASLLNEYSTRLEPPRMQQREFTYERMHHHSQTHSASAAADCYIHIPVKNVITLHNEEQQCPFTKLGPFLTQVGRRVTKPRLGDVHRADQSESVWLLAWMGYKSQAPLECLQVTDLSSKHRNIQLQ